MSSLYRQHLPTLFEKNYRSNFPVPRMTPLRSDIATVVVWVGKAYASTFSPLALALGALA
jgi:hypothetical protein